MNKTLIAATAMASMMGTAAMSETIGVSMALFDDNFLTVLRNGMIESAEGMDGVDVQVEDAQNDVAKQLDQINNFIASGVDAIIVNPVDTSATDAMSAAARNAMTHVLGLVPEDRVLVVTDVDTLVCGQAFAAGAEAAGCDTLLHVLPADERPLLGMPPEMADLLDEPARCPSAWSGSASSTTATRSAWATARASTRT